jgi:hypothetical protein
MARKTKPLLSKGIRPSKYILPKQHSAGKFAFKIRAWNQLNQSTGIKCCPLSRIGKRVARIRLAIVNPNQFPTTGSITGTNAIRWINRQPMITGHLLLKYN